MSDPVSRILTHHGIYGPWAPLRATGVANRIYATQDVVLRIATDHPEAVPDARTESVAAPVARAAGVMVPELLVFDDSRTLLDRPYSIWERVHGETLGLLAPDIRTRPETWSAVGRQLALLHNRVQDCPDPRNWLDQPDRDMNLAQRLDELASTSCIDAATAREIGGWIQALQPALVAVAPRRFLHNDGHEMNLMCSKDGSLLAVIDWGDAGWGDPVLEFAQLPLAVVPFVIAAYEADAPGCLGEAPLARVSWDHLGYAMETLPDDFRLLEELRHFLQTGSCFSL